ncbi:hypothetical protein BH11BAC5_BH11BAC5_51550 [soil metagenome]
MELLLTDFLCNRVGPELELKNKAHIIAKK